MEEKLVWDVSKLIKGDFEREVWKMDTSHMFILKSFLKNDNNGKIKIQKIGEEYEFLQPKVLNKNGKSKYGRSAVHQYLRILTFYNVIDHDTWIKNDIKSRDSMVTHAVKYGLDIKPNTDAMQYLRENSFEIFENIKKVLQFGSEVSGSNKLLRDDFIKITTTAEFVLNYKNEFERSSKKTIEKYFDNYKQFTNTEIKKRGKDSSENYITSYKDYIAVSYFFEKMFACLILKDKKVIKDLWSNIDDVNYDFGTYGYFGEVLVNKMLSEENDEEDAVITWQSQIVKTAPYDFKVDKPNNELFVEVKTKVASNPKIAFQLSGNEHKIYNEHEDNYKIYYVDGIYNLKNLEEILDLKGSAEEFIKKNNIDVKILGYQELKDLSYVPKGFWVREK